MNFTQYFVSGVMVASSLVSTAVFAQTRSDTNSASTAATSAAATDMTEGEIRKVDKDAGKVTINHGEIKNLSMPPMTMVFQVKEKAMLDKVKAGDKIKFRVVNDSGSMVVTDLQSLK